MSQHQEVRTKTITRFIPGQGHLVEEIEIGAKAVAAGVIAAAKVLTADDVSVELARQVCEAAGLAVVPLSFLNPEQLAELGVQPPTGGAGTEPGKSAAQQTLKEPGQKAHKLGVEEMIAKVKAAESFDDLNNLMADETRKTVMVAAEERARELKELEAK